MDDTLTLDTLRTTIASALKLDDLSKEDQEEVVGGLADVVMRRTLLDLTLALPEEKQEAFLTLVNEGNQEELKVFVEKNIPDAQTIIKNAVNGEINSFLEAQKNNFS